MVADVSARRPDSGCAALRIGLGEPLQGTAPERASSWLLVEHPGPWPSAGWPADLPAPTAAVLEAAVVLSVRPQLIRPVRERRRRDRSMVLVASCRPGRSWLEARELSDLREIADLDLDAVAEGGAPGFGEPSTEPVLLVCTHGKRDVCCARRGRPLARALEEELPGRVWETTHVGGDRFAANVVTLPHGTYHGGVTTDIAGVLVRAALSRHVVPEHLRGTAGLPAAAQAAEFFVRRELGITALDAVRAATPPVPVPVPVLLDGVEDVLVHVGTRSFTVRLSRRQVDEVRLTSCAGGGTHDRPYVHELVSLTELAQPVVA